MSTFADQVQETLDRHGWGLTTLDATHRCVEEGVISDRQVRNAGIRYYQDKVRAAMRERDGAGLPAAGQTTRRDEDSGSPIWERREKWGSDDYQLNFDLRMDQGAAHIREAEALREEHKQRYGSGLEVKPEHERFLRETAPWK